MGVERPAKIADSAQARSAKRKVLHVHLADDCAAGGQQPGDDAGVKVGGIAVHEMRAQGKRNPGQADVVLEADGFAGERTLVSTRHPTFADKDVERVLVFGRTVARIAVGDIQGQMLLFDPQLVKALKAVDVLKHARLHAARLGLAEGEAERSAVCDHILDSGPWQHTPASFCVFPYRREGGLVKRATARPWRAGSVLLSVGSGLRETGQKSAPRTRPG